MAVSFTTREDGIIEAHVRGAESVLDQALNDSVTSRAPRGAVHQGLSTYWIDRVESALRTAVDERSSTVFAAGNVTYLRLSGDRVVAAYEFDADEQDAEYLSVGEFTALLNDWRSQVVEAGGATGAAAALIEGGPTARPMGPAT